MTDPTTVFVIPDTQVKPGVPTAHLGWIGQYIADKARGRKGCHVVHIGDHWDFPSLSSYDKGTGKMEGRRYSDDLEAGNAAFRLLNTPLLALEDKLAPDYDLTKWFLFGNHEERANRAANANAQLDGTVGAQFCNTQDWNRVPFLQPLVIGGVAFAHYFYNPMTGKPWGGMIETRIKNVGQSFVMGHQQQFKYGQVPVLGGRRIGVVAGNCYLHDEEYLGAQGNQEWRGILVLHQVENGEFDLMQVSLDFLCRRYEGVTLSHFLGKSR